MLCYAKLYFWEESDTSPENGARSSYKKEVLFNHLLLKPTATAAGARSRWIFYFIFFFNSIRVSSSFHFPLFSNSFFLGFFFTTGIAGATMQSRWVRQALSCELISIIQMEWRWRGENRKTKKYQIKSNKDFVRSFVLSRGRLNRRRREPQKRKEVGGGEENHITRMLCMSIIPTDIGNRLSPKNKKKGTWINDWRVQKFESGFNCRRLGIDASPCFRLPDRPSAKRDKSPPASCFRYSQYFFRKKKLVSKK